MRRLCGNLRGNCARVSSLAPIVYFAISGLASKRRTRTRGSGSILHQGYVNDSGQECPLYTCTSEDGCAYYAGEGARATHTY
jgi:hypothetical protein